MEFPTVDVDELNIIDLMEEREYLLEKSLAPDFNRLDHVRLTWIRWQLDRIEQRERERAEALSPHLAG